MDAQWECCIISDSEDTQSLPSPYAGVSQVRRFWEQEELEIQPRMSADDELCESIYQNNTTRREDGRYVVDLPFHQDPTTLGESRAAAVRRLFALERKNVRYAKELQEYGKFMDTYESLGHM